MNICHKKHYNWNLEQAKNIIDEWIKINDVTRTLQLSNLALDDDDFNELNFPHNVTKINCKYNKLTQLKLNTDNLLSLDCSYNCLTKLTLNAPKLLSLNCSDNYLTNLTLNAPELLSLNCRYNKLTELQFTSLKLRRLLCFVNKYLYLPLKHRNKFLKLTLHINYNYKAYIIQQNYRQYKARVLVKYLNSFYFLYNDINHIISLY